MAIPLEKRIRNILDSSFLNKENTETFLKIFLNLGAVEYKSAGCKYTVNRRLFLDFRSLFKVVTRRLRLHGFLL